MSDGKVAPGLPLDGVRHSHRPTFLVLAVAVSSMAMLQSVVIPVLPALQQELGTDSVGITWVLTSFLLSASVCTPIIGRCGDLFGRKRVFVWCLVVLALSTVMAAFATTLAVMIVSRVLQGVAGGLLPAAFGIVRDVFPPARVAGAIGSIAALIAVGFGMGIVVSGPIESTFGVRWLFGLPFVVITLAAVCAAMVVAPDATRSSGARVNWPAAVVLAGWLLTLLIAISRAPTIGWASWPFAGLIAVAILLFGLWLAVELRSTVPLIDVRIMREPTVWAGNLSSFLLGVGMFAAFTALPQFLQSPETDGFGVGASSTVAGLMIMPISAGMFVLGLFAGRLTRRFGARLLLIVGSLVASVGYLALAAAHTTAGLIYVWCTIVGVGLGLAFSAVSNLVIAAVPPDQTGAVSGMNVNIRTVGGAVGAALMASLVTVGGDAPGAPSDVGYTLGFVMIGVAVALSAAAAAVAPSR